MHKQWPMAMASTFLFPCLFFFLCSTLFPSTVHSIKDGFVVPLIHRDSPQSPFYNHSMTTYDRLLGAAHRFVSRQNHLSSRRRTASNSNAHEITTRLVHDNLEYIMTFYIGTPPSKLTVFVDAGSGFIWAKCQICEKCHLSPIFEPLRSFSYTNFSCGTESCRHLDEFPGRKTCIKDMELCTYALQYLDDSNSAGYLAKEKFSYKQIRGVLEDLGYMEFGCSNTYSDHFRGLQDGCVGLNRGHFSFITQLGIRKFSHCFVLPEYEARGSSMLFGSVAKIYGDVTPYLEEKEDLYYVNLEGISIGDQRVPIPAGTFNLTFWDEGGFAVDTGTTYTNLISEGFEPFLNMMRQVVHLQQRRGPPPFELCYEAKPQDFYNVPFVTFHLTGVDLNLEKQNTFVELRLGFWCLAIIRSTDSLSILGSFQQRGLMVGYDLDRKIVSFGSADCSTV